MRSFVLGTRHYESIFSLRGKGHLHQTWLGSGYHHRQVSGLRLRGDILQENWNDAVSKIRGQLHVLGLRLFGMITGDHRDLIPSGVDCDVKRLRKRWPFSHGVVADETKISMLGEYRCLFVQRAIFEVKDEMYGDAASVSHLDGIPRGENFTFERAQDQKPLHGAFLTVHRYLPN